MKKRRSLRKNVGPFDRVVRVLLGLALLVIPIKLGWSPWIVAGIAALGGSQIIEGTIGY